ATGEGAVRAWDDLGRAALCLGAARGALDAAVAYSKERKQFGRPISAFQAIQWKIADGVTELEAARLLMLRAAVTPRLEGADMAAAMAGQVAVRVCSEAPQVHGGYGYTAEYPVERPLRAVRMLAQPDAARASVAARALA
ncbi:MAG TPA: acyl-CoA dehydrogenase family protein, partial [Polyangiaceae bacterium LLY-WYZ-15_(1-7)]|nr:acyl-CoA dehydrogenase family protein [Polyangiaceae bacterium LLY-WYZ-15_(1-7)]